MIVTGDMECEVREGHSVINYTLYCIIGRIISISWHPMKEVIDTGDMECEVREGQSVINYTLYFTIGRITIILCFLIKNTV